MQHEEFWNKKNQSNDTPPEEIHEILSTNPEEWRSMNYQTSISE